MTTCSSISRRGWFKFTVRALLIARGDEHVSIVRCIAMSDDEVQRAKQAYPEARFD